MGTLWRMLLLCLNISQVLGLRCFQCIGTASSCRMTRKKCPIYETTCISLAYRSQDMQSSQNTVIKGCASPVLCNQTSAVDIGRKSIYMSATCCDTDYCNIDRYSTVPVFSNRMECYTCKDPKKACSLPNLQPLFCDQVNNWCVDVITKNITNRTDSGFSYTKGCGSGEACATLQAYNTGSHQHYSQNQCCRGDKCNNAQAPVPILTNSNGISCWACMESGKNECAVHNQVQVPCNGTLIRCMEAFDRDRRTLMKGCSTVTFCSATTIALQVPNISEVQCCAGNLCNNFSRETSVPAVSSAWSPHTDFKLFLLIFFFFCTAIQHLS
ncbi:urokinase plasminogen activator surface receptor-like isoform X2 [Ascaphus truei]|uniref:urokinase plasminogen activator surface receptor-like isoform X2 n=1 Tax=Ascaphus truei TaxID=8439 RepID=UPI003F599FE2